MSPLPNPNHVRDEVDDAIDEWLGLDEPSRPEPTLPKWLTEAEVAAMEEMAHFTMA
jgi:hypothetical protein